MTESERFIVQILRWMEQRRDGEDATVEEMIRTVGEVVLKLNR